MQWTRDRVSSIHNFGWYYLYIIYIELLPKEGLSIINFFTSLIGAAMVYSYPVLSAGVLKPYGCFAVITFFNIFNMIFIYFKLLETKGMKYYNIDKLYLGVEKEESVHSKGKVHLGV